MLLIVAQLHLENGAEGKRITNATWPNVSDIGIAEASGGQIACRPTAPASLPYAKAGFCQDRFLYIASGRTRALAKVEVKEELVYDGQLRSPIAYVGVGVTLTLSEDGLHTYRDYIDRMAHDVGSANPVPPLRVMIRLPLRPFRFLPSRGSDTPWDTPLQSLGSMRTIAQGDIELIDVVPLENRRYDRPFEGEVPLAVEALRLRGSSKMGLVARGLSTMFY